MRFSAFPLFRFPQLCTASYLHLIFAAIFAPLIRSFLLSTLTLFLLRYLTLSPLSSFFFLCYCCNILLFFCFFFVAFSFKLALKQFYDTISTQQINSLATTTDGDPLSPSPFLILLLLFLNFRLSLTTSFAPRFVRPRSGSARSF